MMPLRSAPRPRLRTLLRYWGPVALWALVISTLSGDPFSAQNTHRFIDPWLRYLFPEIGADGFRIAHFWIRKGAHFGEFFILGWLAFIALRRGRRPPWQLRWALRSFMIVVACALLDEFRQSFVATRGASLIDSGIDSLGGLASQVLLFVWYRLIKRDAFHDARHNTTPPSTGT